MKIKLLSDLHLEFKNPIRPGEGDVLCLAGDITTADDIHTDWFREAADSYNKVFYILGNHEHYYGDIRTSFDKIREAIDPRIVMLEDNSQVYEGVHFVGSTLWTNYNNGDADVMDEASRVMSDYSLVRDGAGALTPSSIYNRNDNTRRWLNTALPTLRGPVVVMTHHAPCYDSVTFPGYGSQMSHCYASDMKHEMFSNPNIAYWFHGHAHRNNDYVINQTRVMSNACGYYNDGMNKDFNPNLTVTLEELSTITPTSLESMSL